MSLISFGYLSDYDDDEVKEYVDHSILNAMNTSDAKMSYRVVKTGDSMTGDLLMNNNLVKGLPTSYPPKYVGDEAVSWKQAVELTKQICSNLPDLLVKKNGDTMTGNLHLLLDADNSRTFGVSNIDTGKEVSLLLGNNANQIRHKFGEAVEVSAVYGTKFSCACGDTCILGGKDDGGAIFYQNIDMNGRFITGLNTPISNQDAATKRYVDIRQVKNSVGLVPNLTSNNENKSGYIVSASNELGGNLAFRVFNTAFRAEWRGKNTDGLDPWIQLQCPEKTKIHKFTLSGKSINDAQDLGMINSWKLLGSNDGTTWEELYHGFAEFITRDFKTFHVSPNVDYYIYYRFQILNTIHSEGALYGLNHWQLYSVDSIM